MMESFVQQLELNTSPKQSCKQLGGDVKNKRTVKPPPKLEKRPPLKTQLYSQTNVARGSLLDKQVARLRSELETEQEKITMLTVRYESKTT